MKRRKKEEEQDKERKVREGISWSGKLDDEVSPISDERKRKREGRRGE